MTKIDIAVRRHVGAVCSRCQSPDYSLVKNAEQQIKPEFKCGSCGNTWQYGRDGGKYLLHL